MAQIPSYSPMTSFSAPVTGVYLESPSAAFWQQTSNWLGQMADQQAAETGKQLGAQAQLDAGPGAANVAPDGVLGMLARLTPMGKGFASGADQVWGTQKQVQLGDRIAELQKQYPNDPNGFNTAYDRVKKEWLADVRPDMIPNFEQYAAGAGARVVQSLQQAGVEQQKQQQAVGAIETFNRLRTEAYDGELSGKMSPDEVKLKLSQANELLQGAVAAGYITPGQALQYREQIGFNLKTAGVLKAFRANPSQAFVEAIKNGKETFKFDDGTPFTPEQRQQLGARLDSELNQIMARSRAAEASKATQERAKFNDHISQLEQTGQPVMTDDEIKTAFGKNPVVLQEALARSEQAKQMYTFTQSVGLTSPAEDAARLQGMKPQAGDVGFADRQKTYERAMGVVARKQQMLLDDPAQYVMTASPEVRAMISSPDPEVRTQGYATMRELQTGMGVAPGNVSVIPNSTAKSLVSTIQNAPAEQAADTISGIAQQYGAEYPSVAKQMARNGLDPSYQVLASITDPKVRVDLANALALGKEVKENLDKADPTIGTTIRSTVQKQLADFNRTVAAQGDARLMATVQETTTTLAYYYAGRPGASVSTAVSDAVKGIVGRYDYVGSMRVPKGMTGMAESVTEHMTRELKSEELRPVPARPGETLTEEQRLQVQLAQARRGTWVTNEDGTGVVQLYPNGQPVMVRRAPSIEPVPTDLGEPSNVDPTVQARALAKKQDTSGNESNTVRFEAANQTVRDRKEEQGYVRREILFRDMPALAKIARPSTGNTSLLDGVTGGFASYVSGTGSASPAAPSEAPKTAPKTETKSAPSASDDSQVATPSRTEDEALGRADSSAAGAAGGAAAGGIAGSRAFMDGAPADAPAPATAKSKAAPADDSQVAAPRKSDDNLLAREQGLAGAAGAGLAGRGVANVKAPEPKFPDRAELDEARRVDQAYGSRHAGYFQPGMDIRKVNIEEAPEVLNDDRFDKVKWEKIDQKTADRLYVAAIAANKSALASLGFDPRHFITSPDSDTKLTVGGLFMPKQDVAWVNEKYPSVFVHESVHRALAMLREEGLVAKTESEHTESKPYVARQTEEMLVRYIMLTNFGPIEKGRGPLADEEVERARQLGEQHPGFVALAKQLEGMAAEQIKRRQPRGPR